MCKTETINFPTKAEIKLWDSIIDHGLLSNKNYRVVIIPGLQVSHSFHCQYWLLW